VDNFLIESVTRDKNRWVHVETLVFDTRQSIRWTDYMTHLQRLLSKRTLIELERKSYVDFATSYHGGHPQSPPQ